MTGRRRPIPPITRSEILRAGRLYRKLLAEGFTFEPQTDGEEVVMAVGFPAGDPRSGEERLAWGLERFPELHLLLHMLANGIRPPRR